MNVVLQNRAAASAGEVVEFPEWTIHNMQDMNPTICANAEINTTGQLTDLRDGKQYWVSKLADGNCWMTQNLDFDDPESTKITEVSQWQLTASQSTVRQYYDPGKKIASGTSLVDALATTDTHYLVGNYYSNGAVVNNEEGICPKNWIVPSVISDGDWYKLAVAYGGTPVIHASYDKAWSSLWRTSSIQDSSTWPLYLSGSGYIVDGTFINDTTWSFFRNDKDLHILSNWRNEIGGGGSTAKPGASVRCIMKSNHGSDNIVSM